LTPYYQDDACTVYYGDSREIVPQLPRGDIVLTDPPYGITDNPWDCDWPADAVWDLIEPCTDTWVMTAAQPFSSRMVVAHLDWYKHEWIWQKDQGSNFANTDYAPMREHEQVLVFARGRLTYNRQFEPRRGSGADRIRYPVIANPGTENVKGGMEGPYTCKPDELRVPSSIQPWGNEKGLHPNQKPARMLLYLVRTYTDTGHTIIDPFMGSGTTLFAAKQLGRKAIGIDKDERHCETTANRLRQEVLPLQFAPEDKP